MKILVINAGSSSLKYQLFDMKNETVVLKGLCERIGEKKGLFKQTSFSGEEFLKEMEIKNHKEAFELVAKFLVDEKFKALKSLNEIFAVGHRIVQGAEIFKESVVVTENVLKQIDFLSSLAPLHNHVQAQTIKAAMEIFKGIVQVAVFDSAFHQTMEQEAFLYGLPYELYEKYKIRKYGFHGTSHRYVSQRVAKMLGVNLNKSKIVSCHLGNGSSICAIKNGKSVDTTMGLTPLDGLLMGTRCGNLDASCIIFLMKKEGLNHEQLSSLLNKKSGLLGVSGVSSDYRDVKKAAEQQNKRAKIALKMLAYQIRKKIAACVAAMDGIDILTFEGGIGENSCDLIISVCGNLKFLGAEIDKEIAKKPAKAKERIISTKNSKIVIAIVPTNEELLIARDALGLVKAKS